MGLDPTDTDFELGVACGGCGLTLFPTGTPKYVWANFSGILTCPGSPVGPPNGTWKLTQHAIEPCTWERIVVPYRMIWSCFVGSTCLVIGFPLHGLRFFDDPQPQNCLTEFDNTTECPPGGIDAAHEGHCTITFGPEAPCEV